MGRSFYVVGFLILTPLLAGSAAFCADDPATSSNEGAAIVSSPVLSDTLSVPAQKPADYETFRENIDEHPDLSATALVTTLKKLPTNKTQEFITRNYPEIVELVTTLEKFSESGDIDGQVYDTITSDLAAFKINTMRARERVRGGGQSSDNPLDAVVDARRILDSGDQENGGEALKTLSESYPENAGVQSTLARYYNELKDYENAAKAATEAITLDPGNPDAYRSRALARLSIQDRKGAIEDINKAMDMDPQDESAKILSALMASKKDLTGLKSLSALEDMKKSMASAEAATASGGTRVGVPYDPGSATRDYSKSNIYLKTAASKNRLGDYESAIKYAGLSIEKNPDNLESYLERANASNFLGRYDEAVRDTTYVIGRDPSNAQALNMRAWALNRKGLSKDAETDANRAIDINPDFADAWFNRALAYEKQGNYRRMLDDFRQAAVLNSAYGARFQDAVAQYSSRVPGYQVPEDAAQADAGSAKSGSGMSRFVILLAFTLSGGVLVALGLLHIVAASKEKTRKAGKATHPDILAPSVFYEGVATGKYKIERKIGEGGMGVVYEATDQSLERKVAIKKMNDEVKVNEREKQRFLEEARTVALLHHPNIVEIHTIFEEEDNIYLVFEHVDGVTLDKLLAKEARLPFARARAIFDDVAKALSYAHSKNVVHRDMKLSNIMISGDNEVKVMDFGLARHAKESLARAEVVGSPAYMPPEQELGVSSKESDVYALGVCLYEALTGGLPFKGPDFHHQKEHKLYQPASGAVPGLPKAVDDLIAKALAPAQESRFKTADEFRDALLGIV